MSQSTETNDTARPSRVIVTGAQSTARIIAESFSSRGDQVAVCDVDQKAIADLQSSDSAIFAQTANVGDEHQLTAFLREAVDHLNGVDYLVNVVGIAGPTKPTEEITTKEWDDTLRINTTAMFVTAREIIPHLKQQRRGGIVNFSTASTRTLLPKRTPYIVSKYAVEGLTKNLARELGPYNVRANLVLPGPIDNARLRLVLQKTADLQNISLDKALENALRYVSMQSTIDPEEIAAMVLFLCSDAARHITGQSIGVDGNVEWEE